MANTTWSTTDRVNVTVSNANLTATGTGVGGVRTTNGVGVGKYYWEYTLGTFGAANCSVGLAGSGANLATAGASVALVAVMYPTGNLWVNTTNAGESLGVRSSGNVIGIALDVGAKLIWFRVAPAGNWDGQVSFNPATGVGGLSVAGLGSTLFPCFLPAANGESVTANFGDSAFSGAVPAGFTAGFPAPGALASNLHSRTYTVVHGRTRAIIEGRTFAVIMGRAYNVIYNREWPGV